ncbi:MAG: diguanylate cyclase [Actinobacteria bacterium]|nr:diguanylate cyclase [Actinomycetota bacterium]
MKYSNFEILAMIVGAGAVASSIFAPLATSGSFSSAHEIVGQVLILLVLFCGLQYGRKGAAISALVSIAIYGIVIFSLSTKTIGTGTAAELLLLRSGIYILVGFIAGELNVRLKYLFAKLEHHDYVDDITSLYNTKYLAKLIERSLSEFDRYGHIFSISSIHVNEDIFCSMKKSAFNKVVRELGNSLIRGNIRSADEAARAGGAFFVILFPNTGFDGATIATTRIKGKVEGYLDRRGMETTNEDVILTEVFEYPKHKENLDIILDRLQDYSSNGDSSKEKSRK